MQMPHRNEYPVPVSGVQPEPVDLIAMEPDSVTPPQSFLAGGGRESLFVRQRRGEAHAEFYERVEEHARRLAEERRLRHVAVGVPTDIDASAERTRFCALLASILGRSGGGDMVLFAADTASSRTRHALIALAGELCGRVRPGSRSVTVRFTPARRKPSSGVFPAEHRDSGDSQACA